MPYKDPAKAAQWLREYMKRQRRLKSPAAMRKKKQEQRRYQERYHTDEAFRKKVIARIVNLKKTARARQKAKALETANRLLAIAAARASAVSPGYSGTLKPKGF